jgi:PAS domain S-box-containing protein
MSEHFIKNNPQPIFIYEKESLRFLDVNDAALNLYGYTSEEFLQMDLTDLYTSEDIQTLLESSQDIFRDGQFTKPFKHRKKDGEYIFVRISRMDYQFEGSDSYLNILDDVSVIVDTEKKKQIFKAAFDNTNDMVFITDPEGIITYVNDQACKYLGVSSVDIINTDITLNCGEDDKVFINNSVFQSHIKETVTLTIELITSEGRLLESDIISTPIFDSNNVVDSFVLIAKPTFDPKRTSTEIKKGENQKKSNEETKIPNTKDSFESSINASFLSGMFHEILTPMNVILGFTQELVESVESPSPEQKEAIDIINQNRVLILGLMNTIIEFADIQFNKSELEISEIPVTEIIEVYEKSLNEITGIRDLEFAYGKISSSLRFNADKKKFINLLNNLFRLIGRISSQKKLYFSAYVSDGNNFNISISDGFGKSTVALVETLKSLMIEKKEPKLLGLSKLSIQIINSLIETLSGQFLVINENSEKQDVAFRFPLNIEQKSEIVLTPEPEKFIPPVIETQSENLIETKTILKDEEMEPQPLNVGEEIIIEEEEVTVFEKKKKKKPASVDVEPQKSDEMMVTNVEEISELKIEEKVEAKVEEIAEELIIPEKSVSAKDKPEAPKSKNGLSSLRCLYIEDQVDSQILFRVQMKDLKNIQFATSFEEALPLLESNEFDFIIMDINLQGEYNGIDALKVIHQIPNFQKIPVIAVTAYVLPGDKEKFIATGFTDFISKPIFRDKLVESLNKIFVN